MPDLSRRIPSALEALSRWTRLGAREEIPALLAHPDPDCAAPAPVVLWMHGRTVTKELDPGRYLRWVRRGIAACAIDLPGHGERYEESLQSPHAAWDVLTQTVEEIDVIVRELGERGCFDMERIAIGGMSLGGMAALARLTRPHGFTCASVEATTGSWAHQRDRAMFENRVATETRALEPILHLDSWREIPLQAIHCRIDEWVKFEGQQAFIDALRATYREPSRVELIVYEATGAPFEHAGFGRHAADAKNRQLAFLAKHLTVGRHVPARH